MVMSGRAFGTLAEAEQREKDALFASSYVPSRRHMQLEHHISAGLCRVPLRTPIASTLPWSELPHIENLRMALTYHVRGVSSAFLVATCCARVLGSLRLDQNCSFLFESRILSAIACWRMIPNVSRDNGGVFALPDSVHLIEA
jgi:hypothetical protein